MFRTWMSNLKPSWDQFALFLFYSISIQLYLSVSKLLRLALRDQLREWRASSSVIMFMKRKKKEGNSLGFTLLLRENRTAADEQR